MRPAISNFTPVSAYCCVLWAAATIGCSSDFNLQSCSAQGPSKPAGRVAANDTVTNSIGMQLAKITGGKFMIGSPPSEEFRQSDESQVEITISGDFYIGVYEVTQREFELVMGNNPSFQESDSQSSKADLPVNDLGWSDAEQFCKRLSELEVERKAGRSYRVPTEAEWEYACRAGTTTAYFFGNSDADLNEYAWTISNSDGKPHPVGTKEPNPWGLYDMYGNIQEMCSGLHGAYSQQPKVDPQGAKRTGPTPDFFKLQGRGTDNSSAKPVARGGAYFGNKIFSKGAYRSAKRTQISLGKRPDMGFRVVMSIANSTKSDP